MESKFNLAQSKYANSVHVFQMKKIKIQGLIIKNTFMMIATVLINSRNVISISQSLIHTAFRKIHRMSVITYVYLFIPLVVSK